MAKRDKKSRKRGGAATAFPLKYFDPTATEPSADAGHDLLKAIPPLGVRPKIGGRRKTKRVIRKNRKYTGGFVPSVMEGFVTATSKYIAPLALFIGYKFLTKKNNKKVKSTKKH